MTAPATRGQRAPGRALKSPLAVPGATASLTCLRSPGAGGRGTSRRPGLEPGHRPEAALPTCAARCPIIAAVMTAWPSGARFPRGVAPSCPRWHAEDMSDYRDVVPGYRTIRVGPLGSRAAAAADEQAWLARDPYPGLAFAGGPAFGIAYELEHGGWQLHRFYSLPYPQEARDTMGSVFRLLAQQHPGGSDAHAECMRAAERLDWEALDELTVLGTRYRVVRADQIIRTGTLGPEPPRPSDPDPGGTRHVPPARGPGRGVRDRPGHCHRHVRGDLEGRAARHHAPTRLGPRRRPRRPAARGTYPPGWGTAAAGVHYRHADARQVGTGEHPRLGNPAGRPRRPGRLPARLAPARLGLSEDKRAVYAAAADIVEQERANEVTAAGHLFRVVRVERLVRIGPDGPEAPRPSDPDPEPPVRQTPPAPEDDEDSPVEYSEDTKRFIRLFEEEKERLAARRARSADPRAEDS